MLAVQYLRPGVIQPGQYEPEPPGPGQVQVQPAFTGICGTDLHIFHGEMAARVPPGRVIGHETAGVVVAVGPEVDGWAPGDAVTVMPLRPCGSCPACRAGLQHICHRLDFLGIDSAGALQQRWNVPQGTLIRLPADLDLRLAALVEPTAVAVHDVGRAEVQAGETVLVVGGGPVGTLIALVARGAGADVRVVELDPYRLATARDLGFTTLDPGAQDVAGSVDEWTGGAGVDVAFEVSGAAAGVSTAVGSLASRGRLCLVAIHGKPREVDLHRFFWRELTLIGARLYVRDDFDRAVELINRQVVPAERLISRTLPLAEAPAAFEALGAGGVMKVLVDCRVPAGTGTVHQ